MRRNETFTPLYQPLAGPHDLEVVFRRLHGKRHCVFFDSASRDPQRGRYSFIAADPVQFFVAETDGLEVLQRVERLLSEWRAPTVKGLPPFQGGIAGVFSYDLGRLLEPTAAPCRDEFQSPTLALGLYDVVLAYDHVEETAWIISQGVPETEPRRRRQRAEQRMREFLSWLDAPCVLPADDSTPLPDSAPQRQDTLSADMLGEQFPVAEADGVTSNFSAAGFQRAVARAVEFIHAGDVFQVNLAQRLLAPARTSSADLYVRLRQRNSAPFAGYFDAGAFQVISASPERFLQVRGDLVETRPIKGTRPRISRPEADLFAADDLIRSEKDRAENIMIVDLLRNDLSRVCQPESVRVTQLCQVEVYEYVQHLVSAVSGRLCEGRTSLDVLRAAFPGGSITGAPKPRAMAIISELEPSARGAYCGSLGYLGFDGAMDLSILIRTITAARGWWQFPVGGGIVAQSDPRSEYEETCHKARGLVRSLW